MMDARRNWHRKPSTRGRPSFDEHDTSFIPSPGVKITLRRHVNSNDNNNSSDQDTAILVPTAPLPKTVDDCFEAIVSGADNSDVENDDNNATLTSDHHENAAEALEAEPFRKPLTRINDIRNMLDGDVEDEDGCEKDFYGRSSSARQSTKIRSSFENKEREAKLRRLEEGRIYAEERRRKRRQHELIAKENAKKEKEDRQLRLRKLQEDSRSRVKSDSRNAKHSHILLSRDKQQQQHHQQQQQQQVAITITSGRDIRDSQSLDDPSTDLSFLSQRGIHDDCYSDDHSNKENEAHDASMTISRIASASVVSSSYLNSGNNIRAGSLKTNDRPVKTVDHFDRLRKLHENIVAQFETEAEGSESTTYAENRTHAAAKRDASSVDVIFARPSSASHTSQGLSKRAPQTRPPLPPTHSILRNSNTRTPTQAHDRNPSLSVEAHERPLSPSRTPAAAPRTRPSPGLRGIKTVGDKKRADRWIGQKNYSMNNTIAKMTLNSLNTVTRYQMNHVPPPDHNKEPEESPRVVSSRQFLSSANECRVDRLQDPRAEVERSSRSCSLVLAKDATDIMGQVDRMASMLKQLTLDLEVRTAAAMRESVLSIPSYAEVQATGDAAVEENSSKEVPNVPPMLHISSDPAFAEIIAVNHKVITHDNGKKGSETGEGSKGNNSCTVEGSPAHALVPTGEALCLLTSLPSNPLAADSSAGESEYAAKADVGHTPSFTGPANRRAIARLLDGGGAGFGGGFGGEQSGHLFRGDLNVSRRAEEDDAVLVDEDGDFNDGDVALNTFPTAGSLNTPEHINQLVFCEERHKTGIHEIRQADEEVGEDVENDNVTLPDKVIVPPTVSVRGIRHPQGDGGQIDRFSISQERDSRDFSGENHDTMREDRGWKELLKREQERNLRSYAEGQVSSTSVALYTQDEEYGSSAGPDDSFEDEDESMAGYIRRDHRIISMLAKEIFQQQAVATEVATSLKREAQAEEEKKQREASQRRLKQEKRENARYQHKLHQDHLRQLQSGSTSSLLSTQGPRVDMSGGKYLFDDSVLAEAAPLPELHGNDAKGQENPDPRVFWDSLLTRPLPLIGRRPSFSSASSAANSGSSVLSREEIASIHRFTGSSSAHRSNGRDTVRNRVDGNVNGLGGPEDIVFSADVQTVSPHSQLQLLEHSRLTPSDMRIKLMEELQLQDEIFKHAVDLAELEQSHTLHTAGDHVRRIVSQANQEALEIKMEQELARQRHAYDSSLALVAASAELQLQQQSLARDEEMISLQARLLKEQERQYEILRMDMDLAAQTLDEAARLVDTEGRAAMYAASTAITQLAPSPPLHYGPPVVIPSAPAAAASTTRVAPSPLLVRLTDATVRRSERSQAEIDEDVNYDDATSEEASFPRSQSAWTSAAISASPHISVTMIQGNNADLASIEEKGRQSMSLEFDSAAHSIENITDRLIDSCVSPFRLQEISEGNSVPPSLSPSPSPPKRTIGVLAGDKPGKSSTQEGGVEQALKHEQQQGEIVEEYLDDDAGYSSAEFAEDDINRSVKEESHVSRTSSSASSPTHTAAEGGATATEEADNYDDEDFVNEDPIEDEFEIELPGEILNPSQVQSSYTNYPDDFDAETMIVASPLNKSNGIPTKWVSHFSNRAAVSADHAEYFADEGGASQSSPIRGKPSHDGDPDLLGDAFPLVQSLVPGAAGDSIESSEDTLDELHMSIEARKKRMGALQKDLQRVKSDREKLEVVRVKTAEKSRLSSLEAELRSQLAQEMTDLQRHRLRVVSNSGKEPFYSSLNSLDVQTKSVISNVLVDVEDVKDSRTTVKTEEEKGFKDEEKMTRWAEELSPPEEFEHDVAMEDKEVDGDSFASEVSAVSSSPSLNRKPVIPTVSKTGSDALLQRTAKVEDQLLSRNIRNDSAAGSIQAVTRGFLTRAKRARVVEEEARLREELRIQEQAVHGDLCVELKVAVVAEDSVLEDSFASDYDADISQLAGTALLCPDGGDDEELAAIDEVDEALSNLSVVKNDRGGLPSPFTTTADKGPVEAEHYDSAFDDSVKSDGISIAESLLSEDEAAEERNEAVQRSSTTLGTSQHAAGMELKIDIAAAGDMSLFELSADSSASASIARDSRRARTADLTMYLSEVFSQSSSQNQPSPKLGQKPATARFSPPSATADDRSAATEGSPGDGDSSDGETVAWGVTHTGASMAVSKWRIDSDSPAIPTVFPMQEIVLDSLSELGERKHSHPGFDKDATSEAGIAAGSPKRRLHNKKEGEKEEPIDDNLEENDIFGALLGGDDRTVKGLRGLAERTTNILLSRILSEELAHLPVSSDIVAATATAVVPPLSPVKNAPNEGERVEAGDFDGIPSHSDSSATDNNSEPEEVRFIDNSFASSDDSSLSENSNSFAAVAIAPDLADPADDPQKLSNNKSAPKLTLLGDMPPLSASRHSLGPYSASPRCGGADGDEADSPTASLDDELDKLYDFDASVTVPHLPAIAGDSKSKQNDNSVSVASDASSALPVVTVLPPERMLALTERLLASCDMDRVLGRLDDPSFQGTFITCTEFESAMASIHYGDEKEDIPDGQVTSWHDCTQSALFDRLNEILLEIHDLRFADEFPACENYVLVKKASFPKRLLAQTLSMNDTAVVGAILRQLREDFSLITDVASGKKHVLELVRVSIMDGIQEEITEKLGEFADQVTDVIMRRLIDKLEK